MVLNRFNDGIRKKSGEKIVASLRLQSKSLHAPSGSLLLELAYFVINCSYIGIGFVFNVHLCGFVNHWRTLVASRFHGPAARIFHALGLVPHVQMALCDAPNEKNVAAAV